MKVLLTGGAGFLGSNIADRLINDGMEVVTIDDLSNGKWKMLIRGQNFINLT